MADSIPDPIAFLREVIKASSETVHANHALTEGQISRLAPEELWAYLTDGLWWHTPKSNEEPYEPAVRLMEAILTIGLATGAIEIAALIKAVNIKRFGDFLERSWEENPLVAKKIFLGLIARIKLPASAGLLDVYRIVPKRVFVDIATLPVLFEKLVIPIAEANGWTTHKPAPSSPGTTLPLGSVIEEQKAPRQNRTLPSGAGYENVVTAFAELFPRPSDPPSPGPFDAGGLIPRKPLKK